MKKAFVTANSDSFSAGVREKCASVWQGLHEHPFIQEVAKGTLPLAKFRFFLEQDLMYLPDYARCIAMSVVKSRSDTEMRYFAAELTATLETEIPNNQNLLARVVEMGAEDRGGGRM